MSPGKTLHVTILIFDDELKTAADSQVVQMPAARLRLLLRLLPVLIPAPVSSSACLCLVSQAAAWLPVPSAHALVQPPFATVLPRRRAAGMVRAAGVVRAATIRCEAGDANAPEADVAGAPGAADAQAPAGHLFVVHGDIRRMMADAVLYPTTEIHDTSWFPDGPSAGAQSVARHLFTEENRVIRVRGLSDVEPQMWLSWVYWDSERGVPSPKWFLNAAEQFLHGATATTRGRPPRCGRALPLLALPVIGTGGGGGKRFTGRVLSRLMAMLREFVKR